MNKKTEILSLLSKHKIFIYCTAVTVLGLALCFITPVVGVLLTISSVAMAVYNILDRIASKKTNDEYYARMAADAGKEGFDITRGVTLPMASVATDGKINWWNDAFSKLCPTVMMHDGITDLFEEITPELISEAENGKRVAHGETIYRVTSVPFKAENAEDSAFVVTLEDVTELETAKEEAEDRKPVIMQILIDNFDEIIGEAADDVAFQTQKEIDSVIFEWVKELGGSVRHLDKERYFCVFDAKTFAIMKKRKFDILDKVKLIDTGESMQPTLSAGIGIDGADITEVDSFAKAALDIALGRGGDQVVIKDGQSFIYYGGKNRETEKRAKVKARVKAQALVRLIEQSENVLVMGHEYADTDALGSTVALATAAMSHGKNAKVVLNTVDGTVAVILEKFKKAEVHSGLFIEKSQIRDFMTDKTLLIICDTHRRSLTALPELVDEAKTIVLIDHHRRSEDFILNTDLLYHEPFASSSCEMVAEMLQYMGRCGIDSEIADAMYAGMLVDTNNFVFKTGVRTFEAAAYLKRMGADTLRVKKLFKEDLADYSMRAQIVSGAVMYHESMAISKVYTNTVKQETVAKAANDLLEIKDVTASFVVAKLEGASIKISGRSLGEVNIQMIMEKLGGGGHMLQGAAQLENMYVDEAETALKSAIDEYLAQR